MYMRQESGIGDGVTNCTQGPFDASWQRAQGYIGIQKFSGFTKRGHVKSLRKASITLVNIIIASCMYRKYMKNYVCILKIMFSRYVS